MDDASREREEQERVLKHAAAQESWVKRLLRSFRESKGRPKPGNVDERTGRRQ